MRVFAMVAAMMTAGICAAGSVTMITDLEADTAKSVTGAQSNVLELAAAHTNRTDNPHGVTAAQLGALTSETDAAALGVIATQKIARIELSNRIIDATNGVWQVSPTTSTNWYFTETYNNITTALPQLAYPLPADFYVEMQRGGSTYFTISCMTDLPAYDRYTGIEVYLSPGGALGTAYTTTDPFNGFYGWFSDPEFIVRNAILFWKVEPAGGLATNHVGTIALQSAVDAKADKATTITINGVAGNLSTGNVWTVSAPDGLVTNGMADVTLHSPTITGSITYTNGLTFGHGYYTNGPDYGVFYSINGTNYWELLK